eukprot:257596-Prymnesium_polylepis.1
MKRRDSCQSSTRHRRHSTHGPCAHSLVPVRCLRARGTHALDGPLLTHLSRHERCEAVGRVDAPERGVDDGRWVGEVDEVDVGLGGGAAGAGERGLGDLRL